MKKGNKLDIQQIAWRLSAEKKQKQKQNQNIGVKGIII